jgi:hypothetical protein
MNYLGGLHICCALPMTINQLMKKKEFDFVAIKAYSMNSIQCISECRYPLGFSVVRFISLGPFRLRCCLNK